MMRKAVEINALMKALNIAAADDDRRLQVAAHLTTLPDLHHWRFSVRGGRIVADARQDPGTGDHRELLQTLLNMASHDDAALLQAGQYLQSMPWYAGQWEPVVVEGLLMLHDTKEAPRGNR